MQECIKWVNFHKVAYETFRENLTRIDPPDALLHCFRRAICGRGRQDSRWRDLMEEFNMARAALLVALLLVKMVKVVKRWRALYRE